MANSTPPITVGVDARGLTQLYRDIDAAGADIAKGFLKTVKAACEPVLQKAIANIGTVSPRIANSVRLATSGGRAKVKVQIRAGNKSAPHAAPFENLGQPGRFRHPVFGNRKVWVTQEAHPFELPALQSSLDEVSAQIDDAIDAYLRAHNL